MAKGAFREKSVSGRCGRSGHRNHHSRTCSGSFERRWLPRAHRFARFNRRILRRGDFRGFDHCAILWPADGQRVRRSGGACSIFFAHPRCNLSARAAVNQ